MDQSHPSTPYNPCFPIPDVGEMSREELEATLFGLVENIGSLVNAFDGEDLKAVLQDFMIGADITPHLDARRKKLGEENWGALDGTSKGGQHG